MGASAELRPGRKMNRRLDHVVERRIVRCERHPEPQRIPPNRSVAHDALDLALRGHADLLEELRTAILKRSSSIGTPSSSRAYRVAGVREEELAVDPEGRNGALVFGEEPLDEALSLGRLHVGMPRGSTSITPYGLNSRRSPSTRPSTHRGSGNDSQVLRSVRRYACSTRRLRSGPGPCLARSPCTPALAGIGAGLPPEPQLRGMRAGPIAARDERRSRGRDPAQRLGDVAAGRPAVALRPTTTKSLYMTS